ncbi:MAG: tetratricopeptide repeat protein [Bacteroidales bacterium]|nr:tetratricopeptide repeat protein [Bacteroidales bacterium]
MQPKRTTIFYLLLILLIAPSIRSTGAKDFISDTSKIKAILKKAEIKLDSNKNQESLQLSRSALDFSKRSGYTYGIGKSLLQIGRIQLENGKNDSSISSLKKALPHLRSINKEFEVGLALNGIGKAFGDIGNQDSAEVYYNEALKIRQRINDKSGVATTIHNLGLVYRSRGIYPKALEYYFLSLSINEELGDKYKQAITLNSIGVVFRNQGDYTKALEFYFKSLKINEELKDLKWTAYLYNNIGMVYQHIGDNKMALKYYNESLRIKQSLDEKLGMSTSYINIGDIYEKQGDLEKAMEFYRKAEDIRKAISNFPGLANLYLSMGELYKLMHNPLKSLEILNEAEKIYTRIEDPNGLANCFIQTGLTYYELGDKNKAINYCLSGINQATKIGAFDLILQGYENLSRMYEGLGKTSQAFNSYKLYITLRDSLSGIENSKEIVRIQMQADFDKVMQKQKIEQEQQLEIAQLKSKKQTMIANIFILAFTLTLSVFILFYLNFRQKQRHNDSLAFQQLDMERQKSELMNQRDELEIQKNLVIHQRDKIMTMLTDLGESIDYARKIQQALLPSDKTLESILGKYFLFFQPRESVGGDFYWVARHENNIYFAIADCTGHGVPGGFMSMLGVSLLNEMISRSECDSPAKMLWKLRDMIIRALNQTGLDDDSQDGMDIALCMYNPVNRNLVFSGANLSLIIATSNPPEEGEKILVQDNIVELKPNRMPVAFYQRMEEYNEYHLVLNPGDSIYLFSDGYADQFGGAHNKKFGYSTFRNLISSTSKKPFENQHDIFWNEFDRWKGDENQTDDVIVMGIQIS